MGLMTVLKKMKQKEKEMRILILYPFLENIYIILIMFNKLNQLTFFILYIVEYFR